MTDRSKTFNEDFERKAIKVVGDAVLSYVQRQHPEYKAYSRGISETHRKNSKGTYIGFIYKIRTGNSLFPKTLVRIRSDNSESPLGVDFNYGLYRDMRPINTLMDSTYALLRKQ